MPSTLQRGFDKHTGETIWLMLDEDYQVVEPLQRYLTFISFKSPNTVEAYGYDLKAWWHFLRQRHLDWRSVQLADLEDFAHWLRVGDTSKVVSAQTMTALRTERTVDRAIAAVTTFYEYHIASRTVNFKQFEQFLCRWA